MEGNEVKSFANGRELADEVCRLAQRHSLDKRQILKDAIEMMALSLETMLPFSKEEVDERKADYLTIASRYECEALDDIITLMANAFLSFAENREQDLLGLALGSSSLCEKQLGQFFTHYRVSAVAAKLLYDKGDIEKAAAEGNPVVFSDPCIGAGSMAIAAVNHLRELTQEQGCEENILVIGCDIDRTMAMAAYLQLTWMGVPAAVYVGDSLSQEFSDSFFTLPLKVRIATGEFDPEQIPGA